MIPSVSVIIPSYNHGRFINECIESVLEQTYQDFEIIITDDGSTDNSISIIKSFHDPRITLFEHKINKGASVAANNCLEHSRGKYIAMLSSDDIWYPAKLEEQVKYFENHTDIGVVFGKVEWIDENGDFIKEGILPFHDVFNVKNKSRYQWLGHFFESGNCLCHPCSLIRKDVYDDIGWLNPSFASLPDFDLWVRMCLKYEIHILDQKLIKFRRMNGEANASGDISRNRVRNRFEYQKILDHYLEIQDPEIFLEVFPQAHQYGKISKGLIPYYLGRIAIDSKIDFKMLWGIENIYKLLADKDTALQLEEQCGFDYRDFIHLSGDCDPFKVSLSLLPAIPLQGNRYQSFLFETKQYLKRILSMIKEFLHVSKNYLWRCFRL